MENKEKVLFIMDSGYETDLVTAIQLYHNYDITIIDMALDKVEHIINSIAKHDKDDLIVLSNRFNINIKLPMYTNIVVSADLANTILKYDCALIEILRNWKRQDIYKMNRIYRQWKEKKCVVLKSSDKTLEELEHSLLNKYKKTELMDRVIYNLSTPLTSSDTIHGSFINGNLVIDTFIDNQHPKKLFNDYLCKIDNISMLIIPLNEIDLNHLVAGNSLTSSIKGKE